MKNIIKCITLVMVLMTSSFSEEVVSKTKLDTIKKQYGKKAQTRFILWNKMIEESKSLKTLDKLIVVNNFFNQVQYLKDIKLWKQENYSSTTEEFLSTGAGDSEDYAKAKKEALIKLGIKKENLVLEWKTLKKEQTLYNKYDKKHCILKYYHEENSTPIILDNIDKRLRLQKS